MGDKFITSTRSSTSAGEGEKLVCDQQPQHSSIEVVVDDQQNNRQVDHPFHKIQHSIGVKLDSLKSAARVQHDSSSSNSAYCSIYRVPEKLRNVNVSAYTPETVSFGPFHHNMPGKAANERKLRYVDDFLHQTSVQLEDCVRAVGEIELEARNCYEEPNALGSTEEFVELMVIDGLFVIELLHKVHNVTTSITEDTEYTEYTEYTEDRALRMMMGEISREDPYLINRRKLPSLARDLVLLENQIPACVLDVLHKLIPSSSLAIKPSSDGTVPSLWEMALCFISPLLPMPFYDVSSLSRFLFDHERLPKHILDALYSSLTFSRIGDFGYRTSRPRIIFSAWKLVPNVKELRLAGVKLKTNPLARCFLDIRYESCCLEIPRITIHDGTESLLRNLIAYEQTVVWQIVRGLNFVSSYATLMDSLINSVEDVELLIQESIITSKLDDNVKVLQLFRKLSSEILDEDMRNCYSNICDDINAVYSNVWRVWRATVKRDILNDRRAVITFFLGVVLTLVLSFLQTYYSMLSYYKEDANK